MKFHSVTYKILFVAISMTLALCTSYGQTVKFSNHTSLLKFVQGTMPFAKCGVDINNDGLDDVVRFSKLGIHIDFQQADSRFIYKFYPMSIVNLPLWSVCAGDLNGDYYTDLLLASSTGVSTLLYNEKVDAFEEFPIDSKIYSQRSTLQDVDGDGDLDAFVCNDDGPSQTYENLGSGLLKPNPQLLKTSTLPGNYSAIWCDYNNDGKSDLYVSKCRVDAKPGDLVRTNLLYRNNGDGTYTDIAKTAGVDDNAQSWSTAIEDFDNDGDMDFFVVNHDENNKFFRNNADGTFTEVIDDTGIDKYDLGGFENLTGDFNNDGYIDILSDLKSELYLGKGDLTFEAQDLPFKPAAIADFNNDGFLDVTQRSQLWLNDGNAHHWLKLRLNGDKKNTNGIGAKLKIKWSKGTQIREVRSGQGYSPMGTLDAHFGLGKDTIIDSLYVNWPSGLVTKMNHLSVDTTYIVTEAPCLLLAKKISLADTLYLCKGDTLSLSIDDVFYKYQWSNGDTTSTTNIYTSGRYFVKYFDHNLCSGLSVPVTVVHADATKPLIKVINPDTNICDGENLKLTAIAEGKIKWNDGNTSPTIEVKNTGKYYFVEDAQCSDAKFYSDTINVTVNEVQPLEIDSIRYSTDSVRIFLNGNNCIFFDDALTQSILFEGCEYAIARPIEDRVLYAERRLALPDAAISCGKLDTAGFRNDITSQKQMYFSLWDTITFDSVDMYINKSSAEGIRNIMIKDWFGNMVYNEKHTLLYGKNTVGIDKKLYPGKYILACDRSDQLMNIGPQDYPFPIGDVGTIDSSSVSLNFYPYFYNWQVHSESKYCSSTRIPIVINALATQDENENFAVYPNPTNDQINILSDDNSPTIPLLIADLHGKRMNITYAIINNVIQIDLHSLPTGVYYIKVLKKGKVYIKTFFKGI